MIQSINDELCRLQSELKTLTNGYLASGFECIMPYRNIPVCLEKKRVEIFKAIQNGVNCSISCDASQENFFRSNTEEMITAMLETNHAKILSRTGGIPDNEVWFYVSNTTIRATEILQLEPSFKVNLYGDEVQFECLVIH